MGRVSFEEGWFGDLNGGLVAGLLMIAIAVVWFAVGYFYMGSIFFYPPILLLIGIGAVVKGLFDRG